MVEGVKGFCYGSVSLIGMIYTAIHNPWSRIKRFSPQPHPGWLVDVCQGFCHCSVSLMGIIYTTTTTLGLGSGGGVFDDFGGVFGDGGSRDSR